MDVRALTREALAFLIAGVVVVLVLALYSFSSNDPSLNHETQAAVVNMTGLVGAYAADFLFQLFGYSAWLWIVLLLALAVRIAFGRSPYLGGWTSLFWLPVILAASALLNAHLAALLPAGLLLQLPAGPGGALGAMLDKTLSAPLHDMGRDVLLGTLMISSLVAASRLSLLMLLQKVYLMILAVLSFFGRVVARIFSKASNRKDRMEAREVRQKIRKKRPRHIAESEPDVAPPAKVKVSRRAREQQQTELAFLEPSATGFKLPSLHLFNSGSGEEHQHSQESLQAVARMLEKKLLDYRVEGKVVAVQPGPVVTQFEFEPMAGTKVNRIIALQDDLARSMAAISVRVAGNIPGKNAIGIELPNEIREGVFLHKVLASKEFARSS